MEINFALFYIFVIFLFNPFVFLGVYYHNFCTWFQFENNRKPFNRHMVIVILLYIYIYQAVTLFGIISFYYCFTSVVDKGVFGFNVR